MLWIVGFLLLDLYFNLIPRLITLDVLPWLAYAFGFYAVAHLFARYVLKLKGVTDFGLQLHKGWFKFLMLGFVIGLLNWCVKYLAFYQMGKFEVTGMMETGYIVPMLAQALVGMLLASAMNDVICRGYWLPYFRRNNLMAFYILFTTIVYALDDSWNEGITITNFIFSAVLGISLAYTVVKTGAIWMAIGIHWGANMMYRAMFGFNGQGMWQVNQLQDGVVYEWVSIGITALIFPVVYLLLRNKKPAQAPADLQLKPSTGVAV
ncbi:CPBP family intramembrane metalloprotease [Pontibacter sp. BT327]|uniref:CPBP family intramembrane metalloprotease n=1 Tax=Pontibacter burrus TaxID=2704466 RepID=A0A6B3LQK9_9BACT|nr:CPBP family intramembrane metalloprotease [Pontibacter burrus]